mgnify:CR=1 FL=1
MFIVFFGSVVLRDSPLSAVQMLWVNLVMDTLGALALATEPPAWDILKRQPYHKDNAIVTQVMWRNVFGHAILQIIILVIILFAGQGWLCENYSTKCLTFSESDSTICTLYNPYYAEALYENQGTIANWANLNLGRDDFDRVSIDKMTCDHLKEGSEVKTCTEDELANNVYLPQDFP